MNETELVQKIRWAIDDKNEDRVEKNTLSEESYARAFKPELHRGFISLGLRSRGWKWRRFVDYCTHISEDYEYLYDRTLQLVLDLRNSYDEFFELQLDEGRYKSPNPLADLNRLYTLFEKYFQTYYRIKNKIHFDRPVEEHRGSTIRGKISWDRTIRNSIGFFPMEFRSAVRKKDFSTPENILLILCAEWIYSQSSRLLTADFADPLNTSQTQVLKKIISTSKQILTNFPLPTVLLHSKIYWNLSPDDARVRKLIRDTRDRISKKMITDKSYGDLLEWITRFKEQNLWLVNSDTPTQRPLKTRKNLDTMYEAWIFFEFANYFKRSGELIDIVIQDGERKFEFSLEGCRLTFHWEKRFVPSEENDEEDSKKKHAWAAEALPDFTVFLGDKILGVFDAKNYSVGESQTGPVNKILAYMTNLDTNLGVLFFPYRPEFWDEFPKMTRKKYARSKLETSSPPLTENSINQKAGSLKGKEWKDLDPDEQKILWQYRPRPEDTKWRIRNDSKPKMADPNLTMSICRLTPSGDLLWSGIRDDVIEFVCHELSGRIRLEAAKVAKK